MMISPLFVLSIHLATFTLCDHVDPSSASSRVAHRLTLRAGATLSSNSGLRNASTAIVLSAASSSVVASASVQLETCSPAQGEQPEDEEQLFVTIKLWGSENCSSTVCSAMFLTEPHTGKPYGDAGGWPNTIDDANNAEPILIGTYGYNCRPRSRSRRVREGGGFSAVWQHETRANLLP